MQNEQHYIKGFNSGYIVAKHNPTLINSISASLSPDNLYLEGMINGKQELEFEQIRDQLKEIENLRANSNDLEIEFGRE